MNPGYLFTLAGLLSFGTLGILHKIADVKKCRPEAVNALIYGWSLLFSLITVTAIQHSTPVAPAPVVWIAIPFGVSASIAILAFQAGIRHGDIATSWLAINLSSGIPTVASIVIYDEPLSLLKTVALLLIPVSMSLLWIDKKKREQGRSGVDAAREAVVIPQKGAK